MATLSVEKINDQYKLLYSDLIKFETSLKTQIVEILDRNIELGFPIQNRVKTLESIVDKHVSKRFTLKKSLLELQDLVGFRIVMLFKRDVEIVSSLIESNFEVINSYDTGDKLLNNQFGYSSKHYIVKIKKEWSNVPTFKGLDNYTAEIQVRTLSQHNWAETSKVLQYKNEANVPKEIIRTIGRVSALLETVDLELERTLQERENYNKKINLNLEPKQTLNVDILKKILEEIFPSYVEKDFEGYSDILNELLFFDIKNVDDLRSILNTTLKFDNNFVQFYLHEEKIWEEDAKIPLSDTSILAYMLSCINLEKYTSMLNDFYGIDIHSKQ